MRTIRMSLSPGLLLLTLLLSGCGKAALVEPKGTPVTLSQKELNAKFIKKSRRAWFAWHTKGAKLMRDGSLEEALYCLHQAMKVWPEKEDPNEKQNPKLKGLIKHKKEATDTILLLGSLYMKMEKYALAKHYFEKFKSYFPYDATIGDRIQAAQAKIDAKK